MVRSPIASEQCQKKPSYSSELLQDPFILPPWECGVLCGSVSFYSCKETPECKDEMGGGDEEDESGICGSILRGLSWRIILHNAADSWKVKTASCHISAKQDAFATTQKIQKRLSPLFLQHREAFSWSFYPLGKITFSSSVLCLTGTLLQITILRERPGHRMFKKGHLQRLRSEYRFCKP